VNRKALLWSAFFIAWLVALPSQADPCAALGAGSDVVSRFVIDGDTLELVDGRRVDCWVSIRPKLAGVASPPSPSPRRQESVSSN
jgi:hypothetical protein